jgi:hypothetical protein
MRLTLRTQPAGARAGAVLSSQPVVEVLDRKGALATGSGALTVLAAVESGSATITEGAEEPVVGGVASFSRLTLVGSTGGTITLRFVLKDNGVRKDDLFVRAVPMPITEGPPTAIRPAAQATYTGEPGARVAPAPAVIVLDAGQNVLRGIPVTFAVTAGEGRVEGGTQTTDVRGRADAGGWVLGLPGTNRLVATVSPTIQTAFTAEVTTTTGMLRIALSGTPAGSSAKVRVTKATGTGAAFDSTVDVRDTLTVTRLPFGTYQVSGDSVKVGSRVFAARSLFANVPVSASSGPSLTLPYTELGRLEVTVRGLPQPDLPVAIDFTPIEGTTGDPYFVAARNDAVTRTLAPAGTFTATPRVAFVNGQRYAPTPTSQRIVLAGGDSTAQMSVTYAVTTGILTIVLEGLPAGAAATLDITGPDNFRETVFTATGRSYAGLTPGSYTVTASSVPSGATTYKPDPATTTATVTAGVETRTTIKYAP